jgi:hypothetical protein
MYFMNLIEKKVETIEPKYMIYVLRPRDMTVLFHEHFFLKQDKNEIEESELTAAMSLL